MCMVCDKTAEHGVKHEQIRLVGPGFVPHKIDRNVAKYVDALWDFGIETFASCEDGGFLVRSLLEDDPPDYPVGFIAVKNTHAEKAMELIRETGARVQSFISGPAQQSLIFKQHIAIIEFTYPEES